MEQFWSTDTETEENLHYGQIVIITARWLLILAGWTLTLWQPIMPVSSEIWKLALQVGLLFGISIGNFYLTINYLKGTESLPNMVFATSAGDFAVITIMIMALGGYDSNLYVFYFPALLAIAVAFPTRTVLLYAAAAISAYGLVAFFGALGANGVVEVVQGQNIFMRLVLMAAVAYSGDRYRRLESGMRRRSE